MKTFRLFFYTGAFFLFLYGLQSMAFDEPDAPKDGFWGPLPSYRLKSETIRHRSFELGLEGNYFSTTGYFNEEGEKINLNDNDSFNKLDLLLFGGYGFGENFDMSLGFLYRTNKSVKAENDISASGIESISVEGKYKVDLYEKLTMAISLSFKEKMYENDPETSGLGREKMILGDDGREMMMKGILTYQRTSKNYFTGEMGYRSYMAENLSANLPWLIETSWIQPRFALILGLRGIMSMEEDEGLPRTAFNQGATTLYNAVNPSYTEPFLGVNFLTGQTRFGLELSQRVMGSNTDQGYTIAASLTWNSSNESKKDRIKIQSVKEYSIEAMVTQVSPRGLFVKIDKGVSSNVEKGESADIYMTNELGGNVLLATGIVYDTGVDSAIIKLTKKYKNISIKTGHVVRFK
ncbi:MAG: hypothetical protein A2381_06490 [Bdellovibrionales bacterium RIFOXYB1_FULL_37_110]|nr:MAG: hypothetical protein A2181_08510 [Bdellovibrionales bacterium RIFOXYA1_FULL_38_20]OFZ50190.1 MAG: hypothetical protein A2417_19340 [Bdellovibrionales bacterium RIFOXYC1_FULL_37_79]OFZ57627.1 MAG: hypothetical protein A2381_06490 [Bdellovibrionales bacterium RIFOXYB1_FULL_37_110]OFZ61394.1 MAG: hypothetical protein A2577_00855 [Bdellovibrionales bacterium RIFOXYD1_FULL_36_51]